MQCLSLPLLWLTSLERWEVKVCCSSSQETRHRLEEKNTGHIENTNQLYHEWEVMSLAPGAESLGTVMVRLTKRLAKNSIQAILCPRVAWALGSCSSRESAKLGKDQKKKTDSLSLTLSLTHPPPSLFPYFFPLNLSLPPSLSSSPSQNRSSFLVCSN